MNEKEPTPEITVKQAYIKIHPLDNVLVALQDLAAGTRITLEHDYLVLPQTISAKHKFFIEDLEEGADIIMYGSLAGRTTMAVAKGEQMTTANTRHAAGSFRYNGFVREWKEPDTSSFQNKTFKGYHRKDGSVGTANYWLFIPLVFCENRNLDVIKDALLKELGYATSDKYNRFTRAMLAAYEKGEDLTTVDFPAVMKEPSPYFRNVDGIKFLNHTGGCGGTRQDAATLGALLAAYADHPNVGGVTVLSLGCQHLQVELFMNSLKERNPSFDKPFYFFEQQAWATEEAMICEALKKTFLGLIEINRLERQEAPLSKLTIGVKCGGSDGFSGISANPAVGYCADLLATLGGKILLAEFPELCGAEQNILDRCINDTVANRFVHLMQSYNELAEKVGSGFHMNPSPGNIKDGLITDAIKSLGASTKGGTSPVVDVLDYTEPATKPGLNLVCTPGNDVEATTGQAASGATLILFTTGLGTPTGNPVAPTLKIATNSRLAQRMNYLIDIDTGGIIEGEKTIAQMGEEILDQCIRVASGEVTPKAVLLGQDDFIPWKRGVSL